MRKAEFPSLPSSTAEAERRARMKIALAKPVGAEVDPSRWGGGASGANSRSASPEGELVGLAQAQGGKKKQKKVLLMSHGIQRG